MQPWRQPAAHRALIVAGLVATILIVGPAPVCAAEGADCAPPLRTLFSCKTGTRTISICGSADLTPTSGLLQYRFGRASDAEVIYPPSDADWRAVTRASSLMFSGGGGAFVSFTKLPFRYVVYTAVVKDWGARAGVVVEFNGRRIAHRACEGAASSELGPDLFEQAGIEEADEDFELP
jgi:hypothetical protein